MGKASRRKKMERETPTVEVKKPSSKGKVIGGIVVGVLAVGIIGGAFIAAKSQPDVVIAGADPGAAIPANVFPSDDSTFPYGWQYGTKTNAPTLALWEDFQCPGCASLEGGMGDVFKNLADEQAVNLIYRPTTFVEKNIGNDSSTKMTAAWGCAIDAGKGIEFHSAAFANQPPEGTGFTDADIATIANVSGIQGDTLTTFNECVTSGKYKPWAANSTQVFFNDKIQGTPHVELNGVELSPETYMDEKALRAEIQKVAGGGTVDGGSGGAVSVPSQSPSTAPSPSPTK